MAFKPAAAAAACRPRRSTLVPKRPPRRDDSGSCAWSPNGREIACEPVHDSDDPDERKINILNARGKIVHTLRINQKIIRFGKRAPYRQANEITDVGWTR